MSRDTDCLCSRDEDSVFLQNKRLVSLVVSIISKNISFPGQRSDKLVITVQSPSHVQLFTTPWTAARQASMSLTISQSLSKFMFIASVIPSSHLILWCPLLLLPSNFPSIRAFSMSCLFTSDDQNTGATTSASVLPVNIRVDLPEDWLVWSPCYPRDFDGSSPAPQFKDINSLAFCLLYSPALRTVHDPGKIIALHIQTFVMIPSKDHCFVMVKELV